MKQILCFGDSNTYGLIPGTSDRYSRNIRWTGILEEKLNEREPYYPNKEKYRIIEEGLCGRTTIFDDVFRPGRKGTDLLPVLLETHRPLDLVILMLGTNDCKAIYKTTADIIGKGIEKLLDQIKAGIPDTEILLISPIHLGDGVWEDGFDKEFNEESVSVSKHLGDVYKKIALQRGIFYLNASDYASPSDTDREHLNKTGHKALAEAVYEKLSGILFM